VSWHFEIHRGGTGECEPGESDRFPPLDEAGAREVLASAGSRLAFNVVPGEHGDEIQWLGDALVIELMLLRGRDGELRVVGAGFRTTGESRHSFEAENAAAMNVVFDLADRLGADVYDQAGERVSSRRALS
jgi:hypothetical protein